MRISVYAVSIQQSSTLTQPPAQLNNYQYPNLPSTFSLLFTCTQGLYNVFLSRHWSFEGIRGMFRVAVSALQLN